MTVFINFNELDDPTYTANASYDVGEGDASANVTVRVEIPNVTDSRAEIARLTIAAARSALVLALEAHDERYPAEAPRQ